MSSIATNIARILTDKMRILVVDDDPIQNAFAVEFITTPTVEVATAGSGDEGLARLRSGKFDFILVDYDMPGMTGLEFIRSVRTNPALADIPIIMVSSRNDVASVNDAYQAGANFFDSKPVNWPLLANQIRTILRKQTSQA
ncbi:MAG: response regulator [Hyphomicrobiales bacterium]|nr:response regulator [Hyphomicrobiales bacterium]